MCFRVAFLIVGLCWCLSARAQAGAILNLSQDLVGLGIASQNMTPNNPALDARPLFQAALGYVAGHPGTVSTITVDPGSYYFLTPENTNTWLLFNSFSSLTVDLAGSTVYFATAYLQGFSIVDCQNFTLTGFTIDFLTPPYTYAVLSSVDASAGTIAYAVARNWPDPVTLNSAHSPNGLPVVPYAVVFRNGEIVPGTSRMAVTITSGVLTVASGQGPWTQAPTLSTLQSGDTIAVTARGGEPPVIVIGGAGITISQGTVFGASAIAVLLNGVSQSVVQSVNVVPRPGNLTSSNADGIHFVDAGANNAILNCFVDGTLDDAIVMDALQLASTASATSASGSQLTVNLQTATRPIPNGTAVNFVDPATAAEIPGGTIISQTQGTEAGQFVLTFNQDVPALPAQTQLVLSGPGNRGAGSVIQDNIVGEVLFGRGVWIGGCEAVLVQGNYIGSTSDAGIAVYQDTISYPVPPSQNVTIRNNFVAGSMGPMASGASSNLAFGAIMISSTNNDGGALVTTPVNAAISITGNTILQSGRTGIWVGALNGGSIQGNTIVGYGVYPDLPLFEVPVSEESQLLQDFTMPSVVTNSIGVATSGNSAPDPSRGHLSSALESYSRAGVQFARGRIADGYAALALYHWNLWLDSGDRSSLNAYYQNLASSTFLAYANAGDLPAAYAWYRYLNAFIQI